jgi:hypothetical protein
MLLTYSAYMALAQSSNGHDNDNGDGDEEPLLGKVEYRIIAYINTLFQDPTLHILVVLDKYADL